VSALRNNQDIAVYREGERAERGEVNLMEAAEILQTRAMTVLRLIQRKVLSASQPCVLAPWTIRRVDLHSAAVKRALASADRSDPLTSNPEQKDFNFQ
jgi:hypothetical protein